MDVGVRVPPFALPSHPHPTVFVAVYTALMDDEEMIAAVERALGHRFDDRGLLLEALTHSSFANERPEQARTDNDRLEFLGDAVLQWAVSAQLALRYPEASAGEMTRRRADLVCESGLCDMAISLHVGPALRLGKGEERSGGRDKPRLLASALEACIAAVYLDAGAAGVMQVCEVLFAPRIEHAAPGERDYKTRLQEALQRHGRRPPRYRVESAEGPDHERSYRVAVMIDGEVRASGQGRSKLEAEQAAASEALELDLSAPSPKGD